MGSSRRGGQKNVTTAVIPGAGIKQSHLPHALGTKKVAHLLI